MYRFKIIRTQNLEPSLGLIPEESPLLEVGEVRIIEDGLEESQVNEDIDLPENTYIAKTFQTDMPAMIASFEIENRVDHRTFMNGDILVNVNDFDTLTQLELKQIIIDNLIYILTEEI